MILGLIAGGWLRSDAAERDEGAAGWSRARGGRAGAGWLLDGRHLPDREADLDAGWVLFSGGWCFLLLAAFYAVDRLARAARRGRSRCG